MILLLVVIGFELSVNTMPTLKSVPVVGMSKYPDRSTHFFFFVKSISALYQSDELSPLQLNFIFLSYIVLLHHCSRLREGCSLQSY